MKYICLIRVRGIVGVTAPREETLSRLRLRRKYACVVLTNPKDSLLGMLTKVEHDVAYGEISKEMFEKLVEKRGQVLDKAKKKHSPKEIVEALEKGKRYEELKMKGFFRLHSPRGGVKSTKLIYPAGILGNNKDYMTKLVEKML